MLRAFLRTLLCLLTAGPAMAQTLPILDQNPTSLRWYRLKTPHFRVLYPTGLDSTAQQTARRLESLYEPVSASLDRRPRPISVVLQNQTTNSNGFVTLLPRRSEFFAVTPQDPGLLGTFDWLDLLAVHEYRHVVQYEKALQGYGRWLYILFGNPGLYAPLLTVPDWFSEGDAVSTETLLSTTGRGRIPNFDLGMRANLLTSNPFSYPKAVCGSYRDNVPNHYVLGYFLTTYLKRAKGADAWSRVLNRNYRRFPWPFAFSASIRNISGLRVENLYAQTMNDLTDTWQKQRTDLRITPAETLPGRVEKQRSKHPVFTNYQYPQFLTDSTVLCLKSGLGDTPRLVRLDKQGREKQVYVQGFLNDPAMLSATTTHACWIEFGFDPRWRMRQYSNVRVLDLKTGKLTRLTHRTRYTTAALSPDATKIVVVENTERYQTRLRVLNARTGQVLKTITNPDQVFYQHPRWQADNRNVVVVTLKNGQKTIETVDTETSTHTTLLPRTSDNLSNPQPWRHYVLFNSPRSGIDNVFAVDTRTKQVFQVTTRPVGAYHATVLPNGDRLAFADFAATGFRIATMPLTPTDWQPAATTPAESAKTLRLVGTLPQTEPGAAQARRVLNQPESTDSLGKPRYVPTRFRPLAHVFNVYGWGATVGSSGQDLTLGIASQDLLSTTQLSAGYSFNQAEGTGDLFASLSYQGLYPVIDVSVQRGTRSTSIYVDRVVPVDSLRSDQWQYNQLTAGLRLPLLLTNSRYSQNLNLSAYYNYLQVTGYDLPIRYVTEVGSAGSLQALTYGLSYSRLLRVSKRDVAPRWGQTLTTNWRTTPFGGRLTGEQWGVQASLFFPGLGKHHSLRLRGGYQQQARGTYRFSPVVFYPRGQAYISDDHIRAASVEYRLPLADTHWSLGRWLYVQRIKGGAFFDRADGESTLEVRDVYGRLRGYETRSRSYRTAGADVSFVFNVLRFRTPFEVGARTIYNLNTREWLVQPLVLDIGF